MKTEWIQHGGYLEIGFHLGKVYCVISIEPRPYY